MDYSQKKTPNRVIINLTRGLIDHLGPPGKGDRGKEREMEEEEEFITSGNWRGKHNLPSRGAGAGQP